MSDEQDYQDYLDYQEYQRGSSSPAADSGGSSRSGWTDYINDFSGQVLKGEVPGGSYLDAASHGAQEGLLNLLGFEGHQGFGDAYTSRLNEVGRNNAAFEKNNPKAALAAQILGGVTSPINKFIPGMAGMSLGKKLGTGAVVGANFGAAYGAGNEQVPLDEKLDAAGKGAILGSLFAPAVTLAGAGLGKVAEKAPGIARALDRKSIGARQSDYQKTANRVGILGVDSGEAETLTKASLDDLLSRGKLGESRDPAIMLQHLDDESTTLARQIGAVIDNYEKSGGPPVLPTFTNARRYLAEGKIPANEMPRYEKILNELQSGIKDKGQGSLKYLQQQKIALEDKYDPTDKVASKFWRALYGDVKAQIDGAVPEIVPLNNELRKYMQIRSIVERGLAKDETAEGVTGALQMLRTSGGIGVPLGLSVYSGNPLPAIAGAGIWASRTPAGMARLSDAVESIGTVAGRASSAELSPRLSGQIGSMFGSSDSVFKPAPERSVFSSGAKQSPKAPELVEVRRMGEDEVKAPESRGEMDLLLDAIRHVESRGNPNAVSSVGAQGAYQIMPATGREFHRRLGLGGEYDPFNEPQARKIAEAVIKEYLRIFDGDIEKAVLAYHTGPGNVKKGKIGPRGREYVPLVQKALQRIVAQSAQKKTAGA